MLRRVECKETVVADALAMPFEDDAYDVLTVAFGLRNMAELAGCAAGNAAGAQAGRAFADP